MTSELTAPIYLNGHYIGFIGIGEEDERSIYLQRCGSCRKENWAVAVASGVCCWCGWDANKAILETEE